MKQDSKESILARVKKFFAQLFDKLDQRMEAKAKSKSCCCKPGERKDKSCCS